MRISKQLNTNLFVTCIFLRIPPHTTHTEGPMVASFNPCIVDNIYVCIYIYISHPVAKGNLEILVG